MFGVVEINGIKYVERYQELPFSYTVTVANSINESLTLVLPGIAPFWLKEMKRATLVGGAVTARAFKFRWGTTDGNIYYSQAGIGLANSRVLDTLIFGNGQFPKIVAPHVFMGKNSQLLMQIEDVSANVPYTIEFAFGGSFLVRVEE